MQFTQYVWIIHQACGSKLKRLFSTQSPSTRVIYDHLVLKLERKKRIKLINPETVKQVHCLCFYYQFENFTSLDQDLLYEPLLGIPSRGQIPVNDTVFQITIPCKGKKGVASLLLGLLIYNEHNRQLRGTPIKFRLRKSCDDFETSSLCKQGCRNGGICNSHGVCQCPQGFRGRLCDIGTFLAIDSHHL
ncbi:wnt inhibitory factor 1-like [Elysia marginata]|uniref:Wnt inhibitory factor 1-like n=1 Tax=Elysia marginata TaxID=1093978 RepID=A0AAV4JSI2_9GAST|nr:wnt inhibitory factor 1-like [Elysia marginata]